MEKYGKVYYQYFIILTDYIFFEGGHQNSHLEGVIGVSSSKTTGSC